MRPMYPCALTKYVGEQYVTLEKPDLTIFSATELKILATVLERFKDANASEMKDLSHDEEAYKQTEEGELISYKHAKSLQF